MGNLEGLMLEKQETITNEVISLERCFGIVFRPGGLYSYARPAVGDKLARGDCRFCEFDPPNNKKCGGYVGVAVSYLLKKE